MIKQIFLLSAACFAFMPAPAFSAVQTITRTINGIVMELTYDSSKNNVFLLTSTYQGATRTAAITCLPNGGYDWVAYGDATAEDHGAIYDGFAEKACS